LEFAAASWAAASHCSNVGVQGERLVNKPRFHRRKDLILNCEVLFAPLCRIVKIGKMRFFFVKDYREKYRYFSAEPLRQIQVKFSRWKGIWEKARQKLMLLPRKILVQEQAFEQLLQAEEKQVEILYSGCCSEQRIRVRFFFFLQRQRTKHILFLIGESILLPISGLAALLPGPNVFFGVLALLMITHWQALRGINRLAKKDHMFTPTSSLKEWEQAIPKKDIDELVHILEKIAEEYNLEHIKKILWK
jgi:hypothetical protein